MSVTIDKKCYVVTLRIYGDGVPVDDVTKKLGIIASYKGRKGSAIAGKYPMLDTNTWLWEGSRDSSLPFKEQLERALDVLEGVEDTLKELLSMPDVNGEFFLAYRSIEHKAGTFFPAELLGRISNLGLDLYVDLRPPIEDETIDLGA